VIIPETDLTPLDDRFPIAMTGTIPVFGALLGEWEDRVTVIDQARRAGAEAERREERFIAAQPRFVPADETIVDFRLHDGDRFPGEDSPYTATERAALWEAQRDAAAREGMPQPEDTDTFLRLYERAEEREQAREQRSVLRRAWRWVRGT